ncbi:hypothetical protein [Moorena sp. SIO3I6]|uniref:hypothetical protein n=1 Tax=Moorena sp. SIO3I6 TaxID=2607831 RepID=UPI0013F9947A|nr:hypothetical protein [Moorena sp. SIO3I6]NEP25759.1 hypothetical protein [Moorena sp. SIO3I6]
MPKKPDAVDTEINRLDDISTTLTKIEGNLRKSNANPMAIDLIINSKKFLKKAISDLKTYREIVADNYNGPSKPPKKYK